MKKEDIELLAGEHAAPCVSIYMPTHRTGEAVLKGHDRLLLKNLLKDVKRNLANQEYDQKTISALAAPIQELIDAKHDWNFRLEGLVLFISPDLFMTFQLPLKFSPQTIISSVFYLVPLMPFFVDGENFILLTLELNEVKLYKVGRYSIKEIYIEEKIPSRMEDQVGYDHEQKSLQFRSQQQAYGEAMFHGQGEGKEDRKDEILTFFRGIDRGLSSILSAENTPLILAGLDEQISIYKKANSYHNLFEKHLSCHPSDLSSDELQIGAWKVLESHFDQELNEKLEMFQRYQDTGRTSQQINEIIPMAIQGRVDTLFIQYDMDVWGTYDPTNNLLKISHEHRSPAVPLDNLMVVNTFLQGGKIYLMDKMEMPVPSSECCAIFRK